MFKILTGVTRRYVQKSDCLLKLSCDFSDALAFAAFLEPKYQVGVSFKGALENDVVTQPVRIMGGFRGIY